MTWPGAHWLMLLVTGILFALVAAVVDLRPHVDENFFFSTSDPQLGESKKIEKRYPAPSQILLAVSGNISSPRYLSRIQRLTQKIESIDAVTAVKSLTN